MIFCSLELINFGSWAHGKIRLDIPDVVFIYGKTGAGKSTIFKALYWVLYGEIPENAQADEIVNETYKKNTCVRLLLTDGKDKYQIVRYRQHTQWKNKVVISKNGHRFGEKDSKVEFINKEIINLVGLDAQSFLKTVFFIQRDVSRFPALTDANQKRLIEQLTDLQFLPKAELIAKRRFKQVQQLLSLFKERASQQQQIIQTSKSLLRKQFKSFTKQQNDMLLSRKLAKKRILDAQAVFDTCNHDLKEVDNRFTKLTNERIELYDKLHVLKDELKKLEQQIHRSNKFKVDTPCSLCSTPLTLEKLTDLRKKLQDDKKKKQMEIVDFLPKSSGIDILFQEAKKQKEMLEHSIQESKITLEKWKSYLKDKLSETTEVSSTMSEVKKLLSKSRRKKGYTIAYRVVMKRVSRYLKIWCKNFGRKGIRSAWLPTLLIDFTTYVNLYLDAFPKKLIVKYDLYEGRIRQRYKREVGTTRSYATLSGGERQMVDISTCLALRNLAEQSKPFNCEFLILDEPFEGLDAEIIQHVPKVLEKAQKKTIFVISHSEDLKAYFPTKFEIIERNGLSSFVGGVK